RTRLASTCSLFPYTTLFRSRHVLVGACQPRQHLRPELGGRVLGEDLLAELRHQVQALELVVDAHRVQESAVGELGLRELLHEVADRKSTRLNSSHVKISYAV